MCVSQCLVTGRSEVGVCEKKQRREVSINRPASYEPAALPLRHPALTINKIRRIKGQGIKGKYIIHKNILRYYIGRKFKGRIEK